MCTEVVYDGHIIANMGEARRVLGDAYISSRDGYALDVYTNDCVCCCPIDWEATAERLGRNLNCDDSFLWKLEKKSEAMGGTVWINWARGEDDDWSQHTN